MNDYTSYEEKVLKETDLIKCNDIQSELINKIIDGIDLLLDKNDLGSIIVALVDRLAFSIIEFPENYNSQVKACEIMLREKVNRYYLEKQEGMTKQ